MFETFRKTWVIYMLILYHFIQGICVFTDLDTLQVWSLGSGDVESNPQDTKGQLWMPRTTYKYFI